MIKEQFDSPALGGIHNLGARLSSDAERSLLEETRRGFAGILTLVRCNGPWDAFICVCGSS